VRKTLSNLPSLTERRVPHQLLSVAKLPMGPVPDMFAKFAKFAKFNTFDLFRRNSLVGLTAI
jgi:hypothetical protein